MRRLAALVAFAALLGPVATPAVAAGQEELLQVFADYVRGNGRLDPCKRSSSFLNKAKDQVGNDSRQYAPDLEAAIDEALQARAGGACAKRRAGAGAGDGDGAVAPAAPASGTGGPAPAAAPGATAAPATPGAPAPTAAPVAATTTPAPAAAPTPAQPLADDRIPVAAVQPASAGADAAPVPLLALGVLLALLALAGTAIAALRWWAAEPDWLLRTRHATAEAGWRAGNAWSEFTDWVRLGR